MTLASMLHDVEHASALESSLRHIDEMRMIEDRLSSLRARYDDIEAAWMADRRDKERLGNVFLGEIIDLSARVVTRDAGDREMESRVRLLEDEKRRMLLVDGRAFSVAAADAAAAGRAAVDDEGGFAKDATTVDDDADDPGRVEGGGKVVSSSDIATTTTTTTINVTESKASAEADSGPPPPAAEPPSIAAMIVGGAPSTTSTTTTTTTTEPNADAALASFVPHELDETTLMNIFAYLDPIDVMSFAQTSKALLYKVNVMFGMGASGTTADSGDEEEEEGGERRHDDHADDDRRRQHQQPQKGGGPLEGEGGNNNGAPPPRRGEEHDARHADKVGQLESMGFDPQRARGALDAAGGDIERAAELLILGADDEEGQWNQRLRDDNLPSCDLTADRGGGGTIASPLPPTSAVVPTSASSLPPTVAKIVSSSGYSATATQKASQSASLDVASTAAGQAKSSPKLLGMPGPSQQQHRRQESSTSVATVGSGANPFSQVSSWFGGAAGIDTSTVPSSAPASASNVAPSTATSSPPPPDTGSEIKLNAAMANSMASKLTPAELSIILRMREKLHKCEADAIRWRNEKEDAEANLASVEAVKEFLVARVRDTERVVQAQKEEMREVRKKSLEDQEVIVFLDERVKELEKVVEELKLKETTMKKESSDIVNKNEKKSRVLSDMLRFEREQVAANEKEWKNAKKLLVKEVRSCRARIVALEAEIEGCSQQNAQLKRGLIALQSSGSMSPGKKSLKSMGHSNKGSNY